MKGHIQTTWEKQDDPHPLRGFHPDRKFGDCVLSDGQRQRTNGFDFDSIDHHERGNPINGELERSPFEIAGDGMAELLRWVWESGSFKAAFLRFVSVSAALNPDLLDNRSYAELSKRLNCTPASISHSVVLFQKKFGVQFRRSKSESHRESLRAARFKKLNGLANKRFLPREK